MDRRLFLRNAALIAAGIVAADQVDLLDVLSWEPKRLWTGWSPSAVSRLAELYKKTNTNVLQALQMQTSELAWMRSMAPESLVVSPFHTEQRVPLIVLR